MKYGKRFFDEMKLKAWVVELVGLLSLAGFAMVILTTLMILIGIG